MCYSSGQARGTLLHHPSPLPLGITGRTLKKIFLPWEKSSEKTGKHLVVASHRARGCLTHALIGSHSPFRRKKVSLPIFFKKVGNRSPKPVRSSSVTPLRPKSPVRCGLICALLQKKPVWCGLFRSNDHPPVGLTCKIVCQKNLRFFFSRI